MYKTSLAILLSTILSYCYSQEKKQFCYTLFGEHHGLDISYFYTATQDDNNQMWFGTLNGLYTYDNKRFTRHSPNDLEKKKQLENVLYGVYFDKKTKMIWCSSLETVMLFDPIKKTFDTPKINSKDLQELEKNQPFLFYRDIKNMMWFGTQKKGLAYLDEQLNKVIYITTKETPTNPTIIDINEDNLGNIWFTNSSGLNHYTAEGVITYVNPYTNNNGAIEYDKLQDVFWMSSPGSGLFKFDLKLKQFTQFKYTSYYNGKFLNDGIFHSFTFLNSNELLIESNIIFNTTTNTFKLVDSDNSDYNAKPNHVENTFKDKEGNIWFCSYNGLYQLAAQNYHNSTLRAGNPKNDFGIEIIQTIAIEENLYYWCYDFSGIMSYDMNKKTKTNFPISNVSNATITSITYNKLNSIIVSTNKGLYEFNITSKTWSKKIINTPWENEIINTFIDKKNRLWLTVSNNGLYVNNTNQWQKIIDFTDYKTRFISPITEDKLNQIWCVSPKGIFSVNAINFKTKQFYGEVAENAKPIKTVNSIACDSNNHIWFSDNSNGLSELYFESNKTVIINHSLNPEFGQIFSFANGIFIDKNLMWVSTYEGLVCVDLNTKKIKSILKKQQGLSNNGFNRQITKIKNYLVVLDWSIFNFLNLNEYQFLQSKPNIILSNIKIGNNRITHINKDKFELPFNGGYLSLNIGSTGYCNGKQNKHFYQLIGLDKSTQEMKHNYLLSYTGLAPGKYTLKLWAENANGISSEVKQIQIIVKPPFYQTIWFILLMATGLFAIVYFIYKQRINSIRKESKLKEEFSKKIAETEMNALRAQMNPHFMFNALNSIQKFILHNETKQASQYLTRFSRLIRLILEQSKSNLIQLQDEIELLNIYTDLEKMRFKQSFDFNVEYHNIDPFQVQIPPMIIQPIIENAIWHGLLHKNEKGEVKLSFNTTDKKTLTIEILDNGIGRKAAMELKSKNANKDRSFGISIIKDRLMGLNNEQYNIQFIDLEENGIALGTLVRIQLPYISIS